MLRIDLGQTDEEAILYLDDAARRSLAAVLADWLNVYAGMSPAVLRPEHLELVVESRRLLLTPDEQHGGDQTPPQRPRSATSVAGGLDAVQPAAETVSLSCASPPVVTPGQQSSVVYLTFRGVRDDPRVEGDGDCRVSIGLPLALAAVLGRALARLTDSRGAK